MAFIVALNFRNRVCGEKISGEKLHKTISLDPGADYCVGLIVSE